MRILVLVSITLLALTGCISALPPSAEVTGVRVTEQSPEGARVEIAVLLTNPNRFAIPLPEASYTFSVGSVGSFSSVDLPARVLGPNGVQSLRLPAAIPTEGQDVSGQPWRISGSVTYQPENHLRAFLTESGIPLPLVLFSGDGVLE